MEEAIRITLEMLELEKLKLKEKEESNPNSRYIGFLEGGIKVLEELLEEFKKRR
jgi:hypothetical protein